MKMQHKVLTAALAVALCGFVGSVSAAPAYTGTGGTITVNGHVYTQSCEINTAASGTANGSVALPDVLTNQLAAAGDVAGKTDFSIVITKCPSILTNATAMFTGGNIQTDGNLGNTGLNNVEVQLLNDSGDVIKLGDSTTYPSVALTDAGGGSMGGTLNYSAQYYALGQSAAGALTTTVDFTMTYN